MNEIGIRELKAKASELVRHVAEDHAVYTITRRGRPVGVLAPADFAAAKKGAAGREAWARLLAIGDRVAKQPASRKSALDELFKMRRERDDTLCGKGAAGGCMGSERNSNRRRRGKMTDHCAITAVNRDIPARYRRTGGRLIYEA